MKKPVILALLACLLPGAALSSVFPPDYDFDRTHVHHAPEGLSAGWAGERVYVSWHGTRDLRGEYVSGYRLYRASDRKSVFAQVETGNEHNLIAGTRYYDSAEALEEAGIVPSEEFFYRVTAVVIEVDIDDDDAPTGRELVYESIFSGSVGVKRSADLRCFVSAAAYGSPMAGEIILLSRMRDDYLLEDTFGRLFAAAYEKLGPGAARAVEGSSFLRAWARLHIGPFFAAARLLAAG